MKLFKREGKQMVGRENDLKNCILYRTKKTEMIFYKEIRGTYSVETDFQPTVRSYILVIH